ncbi:unnamed protein product [Rangifer tarandus platyrhynchus]|uniref:Uncharacterized protein n=1 Tax=Rangifer tarandus platyrhynchus TaxID=3082113 RepID=A0ABN9A4G5_RANTA|nr:unnamed protein product [Rangifer tarandus platyrhynchus]
MSMRPNSASRSSEHHGSQVGYLICSLLELIDSSCGWGFSGGANIDKRKKSGLGPSEHIVMIVRSAVNDLRCYRIIIYKMWGDEKGRGMKEPDYRHLG